MIFTEKIQKAIRFAIKVHQLDQDQKRKGGNIPYITHPLSVGLILARIGAEEDIIASGILHDTIEDCKPYGSITKKTIEKEFGKEVAEMVNAVTELDKTLPWAIRKQKALEHISQMNHGSLLVKSADQLQNMSDLIADYKEQGDTLFERFSASKTDQLKRYNKLIPAIEKSWPDNPLLPDLKKAFTEIQKLWE